MQPWLLRQILGKVFWVPLLCNIFWTKKGPNTIHWSIIFAIQQSNVFPIQCQFFLLFFRDPIGNAISLFGCTMFPLILFLFLLLLGSLIFSRLNYQKVHSASDVHFRFRFIQRISIMKNFFKLYLGPFPQ